MSIWERLQNLDRRWYYIVLIVIVSWPIISPWGLPIKVGAESQKYFDTLENLSPSSKVVLDIGYRTDSVVELNPMLDCTFRQIVAKGAKVIMWACVDEGANLSQSIISPIAEELGLTYGVDWINLGFKPAGDATLQKMVDDFPSAVAYADMSGRPLDQFPIMDGFKSITDAALIVSLHNVTPSPSQTTLRMVTVPHGTPLAVGTGSVAVPNEMPFFASGQYSGLLCGLRGAAEYEFLTGNPGPAITGMDSQSAAHILVIGLIVLGNVGFFMTRKQSKGGGAA